MKIQFIALIGAMLFSSLPNAEVVVIANPSGPDSITKNEVKDLYLNRSKQLPNGQTATPFELPEGNATRAAFHGAVTGRNDAQLKAFWSQQVFTGRGQPPKEMPNASAMKATVGTTPGGIGYIDASKADDSVKVILKP